MQKARTKKHQVRHIVKAVCGTPWAILPSKLEEIIELLNLRGQGYEFTEEEIRLRIGAVERDPDSGNRAAYQLNRDGLAILLVEQNTHMALATAHRGCVLELGRTVLSGPADQLARDPKLAAAYLGT